MGFRDVRRDFGGRVLNSTVLKMNAMKMDSKQLAPGYQAPEVQVILLTSAKVLCGSPDGATESFGMGGSYGDSDFE